MIGKSYRKFIVLGGIGGVRGRGAPSRERGDRWRVAIVLDSGCNLWVLGQLLVHSHVPRVGQWGLDENAGRLLELARERRPAHSFRY